MTISKPSSSSSSRCCCAVASPHQRTLKCSTPLPWRRWQPTTSVPQPFSKEYGGQNPRKPLNTLSPSMWSKWQQDRESGALPLSTFHPNASAMACHQLFREIEADTQPTDRSIKIAGPMKTLKDVRYLVGGNADPNVFDPDQHLTMLCCKRAQSYLDLTSSRTILDSITHQVAQYLHHGLFI